MATKKLPANPNIENLRKRAKSLLAEYRSGDIAARQRVAPFFSPGVRIGVKRAQLVLAREYGFDSWQKLIEHVKSTQADPWRKFAELHQLNERVTGPIKRTSDFGMFVGLEGGIEGLVHISDVGWLEPRVDALKQFAVGDVIEASILAVDVERQRISLGIKQLDARFLANEASPLSSALKIAVTRAMTLAEDQRSQYLLVEHLLLGLLSDTSISALLAQLGCDIKRVESHLMSVVHTGVVSMLDEVDQKPVATIGFQRVLQHAVWSARHMWGKEQVDVEDVLLNVFLESDSTAVETLNNENVNREDVARLVYAGMLEEDTGNDELVWSLLAREGIQDTVRAVACVKGEQTKLAVEPTEGESVSQEVLANLSEKLGGQKIEVVEYDRDETAFIKNALAPASVDQISILGNGVACVVARSIKGRCAPRLTSALCGRIVDVQISMSSIR